MVEVFENDGFEKEGQPGEKLAMEFS